MNDELSSRTKDEKDDRPRVGSQLYGWGQYYRRMGKDVYEHLDEVFQALRDAGYDYAEGFVDSNEPKNNHGFAERLIKNGLKPVALYSGGAFHETDAANRTVEKLCAAGVECQKAGFSVFNCNPDPIGREKTDEQLRIQAGALEELGQRLRETGIALGIHHHTPAMRSKGREFHYNFNHSRARHVGFCFDVHWIYRGGMAPMDALEEYHDRIVCWHLRQSRDAIWWEALADGDIDYIAIDRFIDEHRPERQTPLTVELALEEGTKITRSVVENHRLSREYVRKIFGA